ncbi:hypothetical protein N7456_000583 [Penicillium angulare]|uniref:Uncharacterized protein n=1 Tax=Penicillium angulare TaxID=116970 RepID=A0A9W9GCQ7_9EURO|nr:hypothetical protein N7456_000583 [Penicillium angulare]
MIPLSDDERDHTTIDLSRSSSDHLSPYTAVVYPETPSMVAEEDPAQQDPALEIKSFKSKPRRCGPKSTSPNTIISIISAVTKAALLNAVSACLGQLKWRLYERSSSAPLEYIQTIDEASRGSWGSLKLLSRVVSGSKMGALIFSGASLTFLATAVDPFAQQILSFPSRQVQAFNETAFIQSARNYTINGESDEARIYDLQEKAITSGLSVPETGLQAQCTIEKCSYPRFVSLGICSKCEDVTERTTQECVGTVLPGVNGPLMDMNCTYTAPYEYTVTLSLKDLTEGAKINNETSNLVSVNFWASYTRAPPFNLDLEQERYKIFDIETPIASFISASQYILFNYTTENTTAWPPKPSFTECVMYWCEKEYAPSNFPATSDPTPISRTQQLQIVKQKDVSIWDNATYTFVPPPNSTSLSNKSSAYHISQLPSMVLLNRLVIIFNNTELHENQDSGSAAMQDIMSTNNITDVVKSISTALTDTIRAGDGCRTLEKFSAAFIDDLS